MGASFPKNIISDIMRRMKDQIECELRGPIVWNDFLSIKEDIEQKWGTLERTVELVAFAKGENDLRIKINSRGSKLVLKYRAKDGEAKFEKEVHFKHGEVPALIEIMDHLGEKKWVFSYADKYESTRDNFSFSFKFGTQIGDFFEIEQLVQSQDEIDKAIKNIRSVADAYKLPLWDNESFDKITRQVWDTVKPEPLVTDGKLHPLIQKAYSEIARMTLDSSPDITVASRLRAHSNDYSALEAGYLSVIGNPLLSPKPLSKKVGFTSSVSLVIPTYNSADTLVHTLDSIEKQKLSAEEFSRLEIIVVDDGSSDNTAEIVSKYQHLHGLKYVRQNNMGRASARNLGANLAHGDILIFTDSDVILEPHFIREHAVRHSILDNVVLISFKENVALKDISSALKRKPNILSDFRFSKNVQQEWLRMHRHVRTVEIRNVRIMEETRNLKDFGQDRVIGVWDLPAMVVTNAISMKRSHFLSIGGFNSQFKGWGMEDTFIGACLIAQHNFIIPVLSTGIFHIEHPPRSGKMEILIKEFNKNVLVYLDLINLPITRVIKKVDSSS